MAWESDHTGSTGVWARSFTAGRRPARHGDVAGRHRRGDRPSVGIDDQANVGGRLDVPATSTCWPRGFNPDGTATGRLPAQTLSQTTTGRQEQFAVAVSPWGEVAVCYTDDNDGNAFDQIMLGLGVTNDDGTWLGGTIAPE